MEAENQKAERGREHQRKAKIAKDLEEKLKQLEDKFQKSIVRSRPYFDEKALCQEQLNTQKRRIESLKQEIIRAKNFYAQTLKNLEQISNEIHMKRQGLKQDDDLLRGPREPGVGAELTTTFEEVPLNKNFVSLPDINSELEKYDVSSAVSSSAVSEKDEDECDDNWEKINEKLKNITIRPVEGKSEDIFVSEFHIGKIAGSSKH